MRYILVTILILGITSIGMANSSLSDLEKRIEALEDQGKGFISYKGAEIQLKGELEYEFVDTERESDSDTPNVSGEDTAEPKPHFQLDKFVLQPIIKIGDDLKFDAQIYVQESKTYLNEFHTKWSHLPLNSWVDVGLYERWAKSFYDRKTEGYPLLGTAFFRDDALTVTWGGELEPLYWMVSAGNGYEMDHKQVAEDSGGISKIIHDDHSTSDFDNPEFGFNIGLRQELFGGQLDLLGFYYVDELSSGDILTLQSFLPSSYTSDNDDKERLGFGAKYEVDSFKIVGMYIDAEDGELDRNGVAVEVSNHFSLLDGKWLSGVRPVFSYSTLEVDDSYDRETTKPESWDREKWMLAFILDLYKNAKLKVEYYINDEETGARDVDNDELLVQLEIKF